MRKRLLPDCGSDWRARVVKRLLPGCASGSRAKAT